MKSVKATLRPQPSHLPQAPQGHVDAVTRYPSPYFVFGEGLKSGRKRVYAVCGSKGMSVPS